MAKNVLLTFLSTIGLEKNEDIKANDEFKERNITLRKAKYDLEDGREPVETHMTNESALRYLSVHLPENERIDKVFVFTTSEVLSPIKCRETFLGVKADGTAEYCTHFEYFKKRLSMFLPEYNDCLIVSQDFSGNDWDHYMRDIVAMAKKIQEYSEGQEVCLSVDLTGGFRNANMIVLSIAKLLQYSGIAINKILYSNYSIKGEVKKVEISNGIYELFDLVSGAEEFIRFGSVDSISAYFKEKHDVGKELNALLEAMKHFAQQIRLCHYGTLKNAIKCLGDKVDIFEKYIKNNDVDVYAKLFSSLLARIHKEYDEILHVDFSDEAMADIVLMKWCLNKDYLQQVLTLYTERVPEIILKGGIVQISDSYKSEKSGDRKKLPTTVAYELFVDNSGEEDRKKLNSSMSECRKQIIQKIKLHCNRKLGADKLSREEISNEVFESLNQKNDDGTYLNELIYIENENEILEHLVEYENIRYSVAHDVKMSDCNMTFWKDAYMDAERKAIEKGDKAWIKWDEICDDKAKYNKLMRVYFGNAKGDEIEKIFGLRIVVTSNIIRKIFSGQVECAQGISMECIKCIDQEYRRIRNERVISNHAKDEDSVWTYKELKEALDEGIKYLENTLKLVKD
ncbi:MAG: TM1812 family CRISPR-associated protein [Anaerovibrio sp.]|uniref:TM1812 family CRISPR-associated protein n=1 Tax=Anaerovibrio sp. TaxID=1872532 RepID=UPI0025FA22A7|nr:TM1812 family CRISPR-associated protein [Anaerovibrio sp.]MCR5176856.1 TM1812 family CRISPR-associated protein [Anaerovibrio sp.]